MLPSTTFVQLECWCMLLCVLERQLKSIAAREDHALAVSSFRRCASI